MSNWINASPVRFPQRAAILTINWRIARDFHLEALLQKLRGKPEELAVEIRSLITRFRPELKDATLDGMSFDVSRRMWQIRVMHPSLPEVNWGQYPEEIPLVDESTGAPPCQD